MLTGTHLVRGVRSAFQKAKRLWPAVGDRMEVRRQSLKLRFWGQRHEHDAGTGVLDLSYESIKAMPKSGVHELRLEDDIGGLANLRVVFLIPPTEWKCLHELPLPPIWILETGPKKRNGWTTFDIKRFKALREIVRQRFYET